MLECRFIFGTGYWSATVYSVHDCPELPEIPPHREDTKVESDDEKRHK